MYNTNVSLNFADVVEKWKPTEVASWLQGLGDCLLPYVHLFVNKNVGGAELFTLDEGDLERIGVTNLRARQAISFALFQLSDLCYSLDQKNLQTLAMQLGVHARNLHNELRFRLDRLTHDSNASFGWLPNDVLSHVSALIDNTKEIITWLDRSPFDTVQDYVTIRNTIHSFATTIVQSARQPSCNLTQTARDIQMACTQLCAISDKIVEEFTDSLILQTAYLERATVRRANPLEEFGIDIESTTEGVHIVSEVKFQSPADFAGKIEPGDEIVQACGQTVVAWPLSKLASILSETRLQEAEFLLKKRPRNQYGHQTLGGKGATPATPKYPKASKGAMVPVLTSIQTPVLMPHQQFMKPRRRSSSVSVPRTPVEKIRSEVKTSPPGSPVSPIPYIILPPSDRSNDENQDVLGNGIRQRRATVSGGSPTLKRLSLHLNRNISVSPRPQTQWFQDIAGVGRNGDRNGDLDDLDMGRVQWKLARPMHNYRASLIDSQLYVSPQDLSEFIRKKRKNSSVGSGFGERFDETLNQTQQTGEDDVFDDRDILSHLAKDAVAAMPSDSSDIGAEEKQSLNSSDESILEEAASNDVPADAKINEAEWDMPEMDDGSLKTPIEENKGSLLTISSAGNGGVHKTWSYPGRDSTAPKLAQNPLATLPRSSQEKLKRFFGEASVGSSSIWYDSEAEDNAFPQRPPRKSPLTDSQSSLSNSIGGSVASRLKRRPRIDLRNWIAGGSVGQVLHNPRKHRDLLPSNDRSSPVLIGMHRLASTRHEHRSTHSVDSSVADRTTRDNRKVVTPVKSSVVNQQLLASLTDGGAPDLTRLKLSCYVPCKSIGTPEHSGWVHRARCSFENDATKKWKKRWLVLKREYLFVFRCPEDTKAEGIIWLPSYKVCPTGPEYKTTKRNVFKLESTRACFYFYCYHRQDMLQWLQKLGLAAIGYESQSNTADDGDQTSGAEYYFAGYDDAPSSESRTMHQSTASSSSPAGARRNLLQPDLFLSTLRHSWRRSQLSRENSNESSLSCHSERAVSTSSTGPGSKVIRDPLHVRGNETRSRSAGRLEDSV